MKSFGTWLSNQERVEVEDVIEVKSYGKLSTPRFRVRRQDGSTVTIDRREIILDEEQALVEELSAILSQHQQPVRHERYAVIMKQLISRGVPYASRLWKDRPKQQTIDLFDVG